MARLTDQLELMAEHLGDKDAFVDLASGSRLTFAEWDVLASRVARGLAGAGVGRGERVAIDLPVEEAVSWVGTYAGIHKAAAVAVPMNTRLAPREQAQILEHSGVVAAVTSASRLPALEALLSSLPRLRLLVVTDFPDRERTLAGGQRVVGFEQFLDRDGTTFSLPVDDDDMADIVYTSGTTGRPKGVVVRHSNASILPNGLPFWSGPGWLSSSPLFTFAGITAIYNPMKLGLTAYYLPRFDAAAWIDAVERYRPTMVFLVPAMAELLLSDPRFDTADLSSIGLCAVGSAPLAPETWRRLQARMPAAAVSNAYGMTEAGPAFTVLTKEEAARRVGSVGQPVPPAEFFAVDSDGNRLGPGQVGELVIRLPGRPREYFDDPEATAAVWHADGLHTGDLAYLDEDGYVFVVGRAKDVIIRGGNNVHAGDVEAVIYEHPDVAEAAVKGVPHAVLGEDVAAWVVLRPGRALDAATLEAWLREHLADYKVPRRITFVDNLPRNATGKVLKAELR